MWTTENRKRYERQGLRYPSDVTDAEWALVEPLIPPARRGGRRRTVNVREVMNGILYVLSTGCQWRALPTDLPPRSTVHEYLQRWEGDGALERIHQVLYQKAREQAGREASPSAAILDSQSVKSAEKGGLDRSIGVRCGQENQGKEAPYPGRYRGPDPAHRGAFGRDPEPALAKARDRDGAALVLDRRTRALFPFIELIFADQGYQGEQAAAAARRSGTWRLEIVRSRSRDEGLRGATEALDC
jgi:transposase